MIFWFVSHHSYWLTKQNIFIQMNLNDKLLLFDYLILYLRRYSLLLALFNFPYIGSTCLVMWHAEKKIVKLCK